MTIYTKWKRPEKQYEKTGTVKITETLGYVDTQTKINLLLTTGKMLLSRGQEGTYDFPDGVEDDTFNDPTRSADFDMADASKLSRETNYRLEQSKKDFEEKAKQKSQNDQKDKDDKA